MKLQLKILILLSIIFGIILLSFLSYQYIRQKEKNLYAQETRKNQELVIDKVLQLNRIKYEQLINDNSGWDDMVSFVAKPDSAWAKDNVDFFVTQFKLSFVLAYNINKKLVYQYGDSICLQNVKYPDAAMIGTNFSGKPYVHYFEYCGNDLIEFFGAIIVPASDADARETSAQGYLFTGRKWDSDYLNGHAEATGFKAEIFRSDKAVTDDEDPAKIFFSKKFCDIDGKVIATVVFSQPNPISQEMSSLLNLSILVAIIGLLSIIVFLIYFRKIVLVPLTQINNTLDTHDLKYIESLKLHTDEFKNLGELISDFFDQQDLLQQNNETLHEINATKDRLMSIIAHDLKNPVGNMVSISELLNSCLQSGDMEMSAELVNLMNQQSKDTLALLTTLFDWARSQTGQLRFNPELIDIELLVSNLFTNLSSTAALKEIVFLPAQIDDICVQADMHMLTTILRNLVTNAIKFTKPGGSIQVSAYQKNQFVEIVVADTGIGMDQKSQDKLFRIESNFTSYGTANEKGTGLGLIICKEFVERHGGKIRVESTSGVGSKFIFTLPVRA